MKAISPVIATVIIVAVAITIAIATALWMTGLTGTFTRYERLEITYAYADWDDVNEQWIITLKIKNTGPSDATVDEVFINGKPYTEYTGVSLSENPSFTIPSGVDKEIEVTIPLTAGFSHGNTVEIKIHTSAGNEYPKQVTLP